MLCQGQIPDSRPKCCRRSQPGEQLRRHHRAWRSIHASAACSVASRPASRSSGPADDLVRNHAAALETRAVGGDEIAGGVNQHVAVRQLVEERRQRLPHRRLTEDARAPSDCMPPAKHSDALPVIASTSIATGPANGSTRSPAAFTSRGFATNLNSVSRVFIMPSGLRSLEEVTGDPHDHRRQAAGVAAQIDDDRRRRVRNRSIARWNSASTAGIHTLNPITPTVAPRGVRCSSASTRTYIVGRLPTVAGWPASARRSIATRCRVSAVLEHQRRRAIRAGRAARVSTIRHASTCRRRVGHRVGQPREQLGDRHRFDREQPPARRARLRRRAPPLRVDLRDDAAPSRRAGRRSRDRR